MKALDERMKEYESHETSRRLMKLLPVCARIDGKSFSKLTKNMRRPYDPEFLDIMDETAKYLISETDADIVYTQSDEINLIWTSNDHTSQIIFDGKIHKMNSVLAAMASTKFNYELFHHFSSKFKFHPVFDCRVFNVPNLVEAANTLVWRESDAVRNSVSMLARCYFSHNELYKKSDKEKQEMLFEQRGINWNDYPQRFKKGSYFKKETIQRRLSYEEIEELPENHDAKTNPNLIVNRTEIKEFKIPIIKHIWNKAGVLFNNELPIMKEE